MKPYKLVNGRYVPRRGIDLTDVTGVVTDGKDTGVVVLFKCASRSIISAGKKTIQARKGADVELPKNIHVFVRDPIQRLKSAYRFFNARPPIEGRRQRGELSYPEFVDSVLAGHKNPHWRPITETLSNLGRSDLVMHLFENLATEFPLGQLEKKNASKPTKQDIDLTYREDDLREFYAGDYQLRKEAA